jgi:outer membrane biosynthesis protein TonB
VSAIGGLFLRDLRDIARNPIAFTGALIGLVALSVLTYVMLVVAPLTAGPPAEEDAFAIEFTPGALVKLGKEIEEKEIPEKIITQETRAEEETSEETVTEDEQAEPIPEDDKKEPDEKKPDDKLPKPKPDDKDKKLPTSKLPTEKNTEFDELPTVDYNRGNPFGDPGGWAERAEDGDPWATAVMKALNGLEIGAAYAKAGAGDVRFQFSVCKDGRLQDIRLKGGAASPDLQNQVKLALERLKVPTPPPDVLKKMPSACAKIQYTFRWSAQGVR